jgi:hypothetical protein
MDLKFLFYVLAGLAWVFLKKEGKKTPIVLPAPPLKTNEKSVDARTKQIKFSGVAPGDKKEKNDMVAELAAKRAAGTQPVKILAKNRVFKAETPVFANQFEASMESKNASFPLGYEAETGFQMTDTNISEGNRIGEKLQSANYDWKHTMVINELLRPVYF